MAARQNSIPFLVLSRVFAIAFVEIYCQSRWKAWVKYKQVSTRLPYLFRANEFFISSQIPIKIRTDHFKLFERPLTRVCELDLAPLVVKQGQELDFLQLSSSAHTAFIWDGIILGELRNWSLTCSCWKMVVGWWLKAGWCAVAAAAMMSLNIGLIRRRNITRTIATTTTTTNE